MDEVNQMFAFAFDHLRAPLAGSPSLVSGAPTATCVVCGHLRQLAVWQEPSRVGVCASCKSAAEMWTPEKQLATVDYAMKLGAELGDQDAKIEALERDAARMRGENALLREALHLYLPPRCPICGEGRDANDSSSAFYCTSTFHTTPEAEKWAQYMETHRPDPNRGMS